MKPYESVTIQGVHVNNVKSVHVLGSGRELSYSKRTKLADQVRQKLSSFNDPVGDLIIAVPEAAVEPHVTVIAVDFENTL
jgi:hypothetical protein